MLTHPTSDRLIALGLSGMAKALEEQRRHPDIEALSFEERLALLVDRETIERDNKRLSNRLKFAGLRRTATIEDADMKVARGLDQALFARLEHFPPKWAPVWCRKCDQRRAGALSAESNQVESALVLKVYRHSRSL